MRSALALFLSVVPLVHFVAGHGFVQKVTIDGKTYMGDDPTDPSGIDTPIRLRGDFNNDAVQPATSKNLPCGKKTKPAKLVVPANPGSEVQLLWVSGDPTIPPNWPHDLGPIVTYLAECTGTTCDKFEPTADTKWAKIDQVSGKDPNDWVQGELAHGSPDTPFTLHLPQNVKPGDYLLRNEIISIHEATIGGTGAEFYPTCVQLRIGGNGNGVPNTTVTFPGAYRDDDPGVLVPTLFDDTFKISDYVIPGGPVAIFVSSGDDSGNDTPASASTTSASPPSTKSCRQKRTTKRRRLHAGQRSHSH